MGCPQLQRVQHDCASSVRSCCIRQRLCHHLSPAAAANYRLFLELLKAQVFIACLEASVQPGGRCVKPAIQPSMRENVASEFDCVLGICQGIGMGMCPSETIAFINSIHFEHSDEWTILSRLKLP